MRTTQVKVPIWKTPEFTVYFELHDDDSIYIHCDVDQSYWGKSLKNKMVLTLESIREIYPETIYAYVTNKKLRKFCKNMGFKLHSKLKTEAHEVQEIWSIT